METERVLIGLRIAAPLSALHLLRSDLPWHYSHLPETAIVDTPGTGLIAKLPMEPWALVIATIALVVACVLVMFGKWLRPSAFAAVVLGWWLFGIPQMFTSVSHNHHILWMLFVVALWGGQSKADPEWWVRSALAVLGFVYFFPGLAKAERLPEWVTSDNLLNIILRGRFENNIEYGFVPPVDAIPWMAFGAIAFELTFLFVAQTLWRRAAVAVAISFHLLTGFTAGIWSRSLIIILIAFLLAKPRLPDPERSPTFLPAAAIGGLVALVGWMGWWGATDAWPIAGYPRFEYVELSPQVKVVNAVWEGNEVPAGEIVLPDTSPGRQRKFERTHEDEELAALIEREVGHPVTIVRETIPIKR